MLKLNNLSKMYRTDEVETVALDSVNIEIGTGEFVAIMGPSGCGKSTLLNIIGMLDSPRPFFLRTKTQNQTHTDRVHKRCHENTKKPPGTTHLFALF